MNESITQPAGSNKQPPPVKASGNQRSDGSHTRTEAAGHVPQSTRRRCKPSANGHADAPVEACAETAKASAKCRQQKPRPYAGRNTDMFEAVKRAFKQDASVQKSNEPQPEQRQEQQQESARLMQLEQARTGRRAKAQADCEPPPAPVSDTPAAARPDTSEPPQTDTEPQSPPIEATPPPEQPLLAHQGSHYLPEDTDEEDEENESFIETGVHIDEYDDRDMEGVDKLRFVKEDDEPPEEDAFDMREFMRLLRQEGGVFVSRHTRGIVNTGDAANVLSQIMYWFDSAKGTGRTRAKIRRHGRNWIYKTQAELGRETGLKKRQVAACLNYLEGRGFIVREYHRADGLRTTYISLNPEQVHKAMSEMAQKRSKNAGAT